MRRPGSKPKRGASKDASALAARINAAGDGWTATLAVGGAHGGKAYVVRHDGRFIARVSAHASYAGLALTRAETELRRRGCPLPRAEAKKKEAEMPRLTEEEARQTPKLRGRVQELTVGMDRAEVVRRALELIDRGAAAGECLPLDGSDKSRGEAAQRGLSRLLDGQGVKQTNIDRWNYVAAHWSNGAVLASPEEREAERQEQKQAIRDAAAGPLKPVVDADTAEMLQAAEEMVKAAEDERDLAQATLKKAEGQLEQQEKALNVLTESKDGRIAELEAVVEAQRTQIEGLEEAQTDLWERAATAEGRIDVILEEGQPSPEVDEFRRRYFQVLTDKLVASDKAPVELLERLDVLAKLSS